MAIFLFLTEANKHLITGGAASADQTFEMLFFTSVYGQAEDSDGAAHGSAHGASFQGHSSGGEISMSPR